MMLQKLIADAIAEAVFALIAGVAKSRLERTLAESRMRRRARQLLDQIADKLVRYLCDEGFREPQIQLLFATLARELERLSESPSILFRGSLSGKGVFDEFYPQHSLPEVVADEGMESAFEYVFTGVVGMLCHIPEVVRDWEALAWAENYRRLDEMLIGLRDSIRLQSSPTWRDSPGDEDARLLLHCRRLLLQSADLYLDVAGLSAAGEVWGRFDDLFVVPSIAEAEPGIGPGSSDITTEALIQTLGAPHAIVLEGPAGSGKTTWTRWLQRSAMTSGWPGLAVRLDLGSLSQPLPPIHLVVRASLSIHSGEYATAERVGRWARDGRLMFLLDGFDLTRAEARGSLTRWIEELRVAAEACSVVVTSRPVADLKQLMMNGDWKHWRIRPFDDTRVSQYIEKWSRCVMVPSARSVGTVAASLAVRIAHDRSLSPLTSNPLLLSTLLMVDHVAGELPSGRSDLYRMYVDGMLGGWDTRRGYDASVADASPSTKRAVLTDLALSSLMSGKNEWDDEEVCSTTAARMGAAEVGPAVLATVRSLHERTGLLVGPGAYGFAHKSLAEYLVAEAVETGRHRTKRGERVDPLFLLARQESEDWRMVLFLWAGLADPADVVTLLRQCCQRGNESLGFGVLLDQFERLPDDLRTELSMEAVRALPRIARDQEQWTEEGPVTRERRPLALRSGRLVTVAGPSTVVDLLLRLSADGKLGAAHVMAADERHRGTVWMCALDRTPDHDAWQTTAASAPRVLGAKSRLVYWLARGVVRRVAHSEPLRSAPFAAAFLELFGPFQEFLQLAAMNLVVRAAADAIKHRSPPRYLDEVVWLLRVPPERGVQRDYLQGTRAWLVTNSDTPADLLARVERALDAIVEFALADTASCRAAQRTVERYRTLRGAQQ